MSKFAKRVDLNHAEIRDGLRRIPHMKVIDYSACGNGIADLAALFEPTGKRMWLEVKSKGGKLTDAELEFAAMVGASAYAVVFSLDEAINAMGLGTGE